MAVGGELMAAGILFIKSSNEIHDFFDHVTEVLPNEIKYVGGSVVGWDSHLVDVMVTNDLFIEEKESRKLLKDNNGKVFSYGDILPTNIKNIKNEFFKPTLEEQEQRIADLELAITELMLI